MLKRYGTPKKIKKARTIIGTPANSINEYVGNDVADLIFNNAEHSEYQSENARKEQTVKRKKQRLPHRLKQYLPVLIYNGIQTEIPFQKNRAASSYTASKSTQPDGICAGNAQYPPDQRRSGITPAAEMGAAARAHRRSCCMSLYIYGV